MQIRLIAAASLAAVCGLCAAESNVTLYGVVDGAVSVTKGKGEAARVSFDNGIWAGSRWGVKGTEDLGNGNSVGFILEQGFKLFNGQTAIVENGAFSRQSTLHIKGAWGEFAFGRMGGLSSDCGTFSILHGSALWTSYYANGSIYGAFDLSSRMNNTVVYRTPSFGGFTVSAMYSNGVTEDSYKWSKNAHYYGLGLDYQSDKALGSVIWEMFDNRKSEGKKANNSQIFTIGGSYDFGPIAIYGAYQFAYQAQIIPGDWFSSNDEAKNRTFAWGNKGINQNAVSLSLGVPVGSGTAKLQGNYSHGKIKNHIAGQKNKYDYWSLAAAYEYPISKRTLLYAYAGYGDGSKAMAKSENYNSWTTSIGLSHSF